MNEQISKSHVKWDYEVTTLNGVWNRGFGIRTPPPPKGDWQIEFRGQALGDELILAYYFPEDDEDAGEWLSAFESESSLQVPVSIDTYLGPTDKPVIQWDGSDDPDHPGADLVGVEHIINIGKGQAKWHKNELIITIPPEVFRKEARPRVLGYRSKYEHIEQRILNIFKELSPQGYADFWEAFERPVYPEDVFSLNDERREAFWRDRLIRFERPAGYDCLQLLHSASGGVVGYAKLIQVLRCASFSETVRHLHVPKDLKVTISHLRSSLKEVGSSFKIKNVPLRGYFLSRVR